MKTITHACVPAASFLVCAGQFFVKPFRCWKCPEKWRAQPVKVRLLEPAQSNLRALYEESVSGSYAKPFLIIDDGETLQLLFSLDFIQSSMHIDEPFALDFAYTRGF